VFTIVNDGVDDLQKGNNKSVGGTSVSPNKKNNPNEHPMFRDNGMCYTCEHLPKEKTPAIWSKIVEPSAVAQGNCGLVPVATVGVDIASLLELDRHPGQAQASSKISNHEFKPLWFVSRDKVSHLDRERAVHATARSPSPERLHPSQIPKSESEHAGPETKPRPVSANKSSIEGFVPFLPSDRYARCLDVYVSVEMCHNCSEHRWLAWHDEPKYDQQATNALHVVLATIAECGFPVRVFAYKVKAEHTRLSSLEVNMAVRTTHVGKDKTQDTNGHDHNHDVEKICNSLDDNLKWLSEISDHSGTTKDDPLKNNGGTSLYAQEMKRLAGLRGNRWLVANLHSKLETLK
jgi:hypothetical protein